MDSGSGFGQQRGRGDGPGRGRGFRGRGDGRGQGQGHQGRGNHSFGQNPHQNHHRREDNRDQFTNPGRGRGNFHRPPEPRGMPFVPPPQSEGTYQQDGLDHPFPQPQQRNWTDPTQMYNRGPPFQQQENRFPSHRMQRGRHPSGNPPHGLPHPPAGVHSQGYPPPRFPPPLFNPPPHHGRAVNDIEHFRSQPHDEGNFQKPPSNNQKYKERRGNQRGRNMNRSGPSYRPDHRNEQSMQRNFGNMMPRNPDLARSNTSVNSNYSFNAGGLDEERGFQAYDNVPLHKTFSNNQSHQPGNNQGRGNWRGRSYNRAGLNTNSDSRRMMPRNPDLAKSNNSVYSNPDSISSVNESISRPLSRASLVNIDQRDITKPDIPKKQKNRSRKKNKEKIHSGDLNMSTQQGDNDEVKSPDANPSISAETLIELLEKDSMDIVNILSDTADVYSQLFSQKNEPELLILIVALLSKVCLSDDCESKTKIFRIISESDTLLYQIYELMDDIPFIEDKNHVDNIPKFFSNVIILYQTLSEFKPSRKRTWYNHLIQVRKSMKASTKHLDVHFDSQLFSEVELFINDLTVETGQDSYTNPQENKNKNKNKNNFLPDPVGDFRTVSVFPRPEDVFDVQPFLHENIINGPYSSVEHYLDTHFKLLREDFMSPIRKALKDYKNQQDTKDRFKRIDNVRIYRRVKFLHPKTIFDKVGYEVNFDVENKINRVNWEFSNRFLFGSLLLFTNDGFSTFFLATVAHRNVKELENKRVVVELVESMTNAKSILDKEFIMAESEAYFEPYFHVLKALQFYNETNFPLAKYIVHANTETESPSYLGIEDVYTITMNNNQFNFMVLSDMQWPTHNDLGLDPSQYEAFKAALTNDLVVIQGPPGTGKTFLGLKIAQGLLENAHVWNRSNSPILVVCFTNHALDQFLEGLLPFTRKLVRIGGKSKGSELDKFNIRERRKEATYYKRNRTNDTRALQVEMSKIFSEIKTHQSNLQVVDDTNAVLSIKSLRMVMGDRHGAYFRNDVELLDWLLIGVGSKNAQQDVKVIITPDRGIVKQTPAIDPNIADAEDQRVKQTLFDTIELVDIPPSEDTITVNFACHINEIARKLDEHECNLHRARSNQIRINRDQYVRLVSTVERLQLLHTHLKKKLIERKNLRLSDFEKNDLLETYDLGTLDANRRWKIYHTWVDMLRNGLIVELGNKEKEFRLLGFQYEQLRQSDDIDILRTSHVVGTTTTLASKYQAMFAALAPKIVIVEEAAEALEAHVVASLPTTVEHLILIGDHKQLRPNLAEVRLARQYNLDISLFERMVKNGMACHTLTLQHRMRPEISKQLVPTIYPRLYDHESVRERQNIKGMDKNVFFMTHRQFEDDVVEISSKRNQFEAGILLRLADYLVKQGYRPQEITILATYKGQMYHMKNELKSMDGFPKGIQITVVDNFQGEENRIILLSLVRSNKMNKIGFLEIENRVCVALSRARDGLYIIGNMDGLVDSSEIWPHISRSLREQNAIGPALRLRCQIHPDQVTEISCEKDFHQVSEGGCSRICGQELPCGHPCRSLCHISPDYHRTYKCKAACPKILCQDGHQCPAKCFMPCGPCVVPMKRQLVCGHNTDVPCHVDVRTYPCVVPVQVVVPVCGHTVTVPCHFQHQPICNLPCRNRLDCGHSCERECHVDDDPDHLQFVCMKPCPRFNKNCSKDHMCRLLCNEACVPCPIRLEKSLPCGHSSKMLCSTDVVTYSCKRKCERVLDCGHDCNKRCWEACHPCVELTDKVVEECGHVVKIECCEPPTKALCSGSCSNTLDCGHSCKKRCRDPCLRMNCVEPIPFQMKTQLCGHVNADVPCNKVAEINQKWSQPSTILHGVIKGIVNWGEGVSGLRSAYSATADGSGSTSISSIKLPRKNVLEEEELLQYCSEMCGEVLPCNHMCSGSCSDCMQKRIHKMCDEPCGNVLICGHSCPVPCREVCPPCNQPCRHECRHSKCNRKCGEVCVLCSEKCDYACPHLKCTRKCGEICDRPPCYESCEKTLDCDHQCVGFCGEPCPPCRQCQPEHFEEFFYTGEETEDDAKWVYLEDCKHTLETGGLEYWLNMKEEGGEIMSKVCPKCKTPIVTTQRFMNLIKETYKDIQKIKAQCYGKMADIKKNRMLALKKIQDIQFSDIDLYSGINRDELKILYQKLKHDLPDVKKQRRNVVDAKKTQLLCFFTEFFTFLYEKREEVWDKFNESAKTLLTKKINHLTQLLMKRTEKISEAEIKSFELELKRINRICDLLVYTSSYEYRMVASSALTKGLRETAENIIFSVLLYTDDVDDKMKDVLERLRDHIKSSSVISDAERAMIHKAMQGSFHSSQKTGHWFKCKNGHTYCITECGGAMQEAMCPIPGCGERIGGRNHALRGDQTIASEMDGARHAAWSDANNIQF